MGLIQTGRLAYRSNLRSQRSSATSEESTTWHGTLHWSPLEENDGGVTRISRGTDTRMGTSASSCRAVMKKPVIVAAGSFVRATSTVTAHLMRTAIGSWPVAPRPSISTCRSGVAVAAGTPAADAGLQVNDEIVAINGTPSSQLSGWDFRRAVRQPSETKLTLSVIRSGQPQTVVLTLRELLP